MSTNRSFQSMLNEFLANDLLKEEMIKTDFLLSQIQKNGNLVDDWKGGNMPVPFKGAGASSIAFGGLSGSSDVSEDAFVRGSVPYYKELWGTMLFNHKDFMEHDGKVNEDSFLKILPDAVDDFMEYIRGAASVNMLGGPHFATLTSNGANGSIVVDHIDRFRIGQKVYLKDGDTAAQAAYVSSIVIDSNTANLVTARGGVTPFDASAYTTAQSAKVYHEGADTAANAFTSLKSSLLSAANGGSSTLYGQTKTAYPYLQAINVLGSGITASNILDQIFDAFTRIKTVGKGKPNTVVMSYKHLGSILKKLESQKGPFNIIPQKEDTAIYGWTEIEILGVVSRLKVVGVQEMDDDTIMFIDWKAIKFFSNGLFRKRTAPDGKQYFEVRATTGYQYLLDVSLFGELVLIRPSYCGILYSISY